MPLIPRILIRGGAGTGKTLVLKEFALQLCAKGIKTLYLCFNRKLAERVRQEFQGSPEGRALHVFHWHGYVAELARRSGSRHNLAGAKPGAQADFLIADAGDLAETYEAVLVDESQDFEREWLEAIALLANVWNAKHFVMACDDAQNLFRAVNAAGFPDQPSLTLTVNLRNSEPIARLASRMGGLRAPRCAFCVGPEPVFLTYRDIVDEQRQLIRLLETFRDQKLGPAEVVLLSFFNRENAVLKGRLQLGQFRFAEDTWTNSTYHFSTVQSFKGLEARVVVLADADPRNSVVTAAGLYVGASRARTALYIFTPDPEALQGVANRRLPAAHAD